MKSSSRRVIKASDLVLGRNPVTIATPWSVLAGWEESAVGGETDAASTEDPREPGDERALADEDPEIPADGRGAGERAEALVSEAQAEAQRLLEEARARAEAVLEEARRQGYEAGFREGEERGRAEGRAAAEKELEGAVRQATKLLTAAVHDRTQIVAAARDDVLKLVRRVAEKITRAAVRLDPSVVERVIDSSLRLVTERTQVLIRVNPDDVARARDGVPHFLRYFTPSAVLEVCADPKVSQGGCLIETNAGYVDAQLETQLEEVMGHLEERLHGG